MVYRSLSRYQYRGEERYVVPDITLTATDGSDYSLDRLDPRFEGLTGDLGRIVALADHLGVEVEKGAELPSGGYEVAHGSQIVAVDDHDRSPVVWTEGTSAGDLATDLAALLTPRESSPSS